eukprot:1015325-Rhodomonas_salina.2
MSQRCFARQRQSERNSKISASVRLLALSAGSHPLCRLLTLSADASPSLPSPHPLCRVLTLSAESSPSHDAGRRREEKPHRRHAGQSLREGCDLTTLPHGHSTDLFWMLDVVKPHKLVR